MKNRYSLPKKEDLLQDGPLKQRLKDFFEKKEFISGTISKMNPEEFDKLFKELKEEIKDNNTL